MGRTSKKPTHRTTITMYRDQVDYLSEVKNVSEWIREAIDDRIASDIEGTDTSSLEARMSALQRKRGRIIDSDSYELARRAEGFGDFMEVIEKLDRVYVHDEDGDLFIPLMIGDDYQRAYLSMSSITFQAFVDEYDIRAMDDRYTIEGEPFEPFVKLVRRNWKYYGGLFERHKRDLAEIEVEHERLQDIMISGKVP